MTRLILASKSPARIMVLKNAGISFEAMPAPIDERAIEAPLIAHGRGPAAIAMALAAAKAQAVSRAEPVAVVIGADQTLEADGARWIKPGSPEEARRQLEQLAGRTHALHSGVAIARNGEIVWQHIDTAHMTFRSLSAEFIEAYLAEVGDDVLASVGGYQIEGLGVQLFDRIEGDYFTILGLPLLPLLGWLRREKVIAS